MYENSARNNSGTIHYRHHRRIGPCRKIGEAALFLLGSLKVFCLYIRQAVGLKWTLAMGWNTYWRTGCASFTGLCTDRCRIRDSNFFLRGVHSIIEGSISYNLGIDFIFWITDKSELWHVITDRILRWLVRFSNFIYDVYICSLWADNITLLNTKSFSRNIRNCSLEIIVPKTVKRNLNHYGTGSTEQLTWFLRLRF